MFCYVFVNNHVLLFICNYLSTNTFILRPLSIINIKKKAMFCKHLPTSFWKHCKKYNFPKFWYLNRELRLPAHESYWFKALNLFYVKLL